MAANAAMNAMNFLRLTARIFTNHLPGADSTNISRRPSRIWPGTIRTVPSVEALRHPTVAATRSAPWPIYPAPEGHPRVGTHRARLSARVPLPGEGGRLQPPETASEPEPQRQNAGRSARDHPASPAVAVGFEPTDGVNRHTISSRAPSAARTRYRQLGYWTVVRDPTAGVPCGGAGPIPHFVTGHPDRADHPVRAAGRGDFAVAGSPTDHLLRSANGPSRPAPYPLHDAHATPPSPGSQPGLPGHSTRHTSR